MVQIILNKIKYYLFFSLTLFFSCYSIFSNSFNELSKAFNTWYIEHHPNRFNLVDPYIIYEKNKFGESTYVNESLLDLKRFKLELLQISKNRLNKYEQYQYNSIINIIDRLIYENTQLQEHYWNIAYYSNMENTNICFPPCSKPAPNATIGASEIIMLIIKAGTIFILDGIFTLPSSIHCYTILL